MKPRSARAVNLWQERWQAALDALDIPEAIHLPLAERLRAVAEAARKLRLAKAG